MNIFRKSNTNSWCCLVYGSLSAAVILILTRGGIILSADSVDYLSIAKMINMGRWSDAFVVTWPPFFPALIALINSFGFEGEESARIISVISYSALVMLMFLFARATAGRLAAHLTSASMLIFAPLVLLYSHCRSETVYIALSAGSLLVLYKFYESTDRQDRGCLIWSAILVALALLTRYVGVALFSAGFLIILFKKEVRGAADKIKSVVLFSMISWTPLAAYLVGGLHYRGRSPRPGHHVMPSLWERACSFFSIVYHDFLKPGFRISDPDLPSHMGAWQPNFSLHILGYIAGIIFLLLLASYLLLKLSRETIKNQIVPLVYVACYSVSLVLITTLWLPLSITTRFCSPIYPFVILLGFFVVVNACGGFVRRKAKSLCLGMSAIAVILFWTIQSVFSVNACMLMTPADTPKVEQRDITGDGIFDVSDLMFLINYLYGSGAQPRPLQNANVNCDGTIDIADVIYLVNYIYRAGPAPCGPDNG